MALVSSGSEKVRKGTIADDCPGVKVEVSDDGPGVKVEGSDNGPGVKIEGSDDGPGVKIEGSDDGPGVKIEGSDDGLGIKGSMVVLASTLIKPIFTLSFATMMVTRYSEQWSEIGR